MSILQEQLNKRMVGLRLIYTQMEEYKAVLYIKRFLRQGRNKGQLIEAP